MGIELYCVSEWLLHLWVEVYTIVCMFYVLFMCRLAVLVWVSCLGWEGVLYEVVCMLL